MGLGKHSTTNKRGHNCIKPDLSRLMPGCVISLDAWEMDDDEAGIAGTSNGGFGS